MPVKCPSPGTTLNNGRYKVIRELNTGGTAVVYEAFDNKKKRKCALKVMNLTQRQFEVAAKLSKREVFFSSMIHHDNFVKLLDVFSEGERLLVLVWELIPGFDLLDSLNQAGGKMSEPMAAYYFLQLLGGVEFMHDNGFCHRDLKAENCMIVKKTQKLKIIDFGLARQLESAVTSTTGTPDYLAPELLVTSKSQRTSIDQRAVDVWAMGVILYLLVTGTYPFEDPDDPECFAQVFKNIRRSIFEVDPTKRIRLKSLMNNKWLMEQASIYAREVEPHIVPETAPVYSIKNLMPRLPTHRKQTSVVDSLIPESEEIPLKKTRRGMSLDQSNRATVESMDSQSSTGGFIDDGSCQHPQFGCGFRFILSKFCVPAPRRKGNIRKRQARISPY